MTLPKQYDDPNMKDNLYQIAKEMNDKRDSTYLPDTQLTIEGETYGRK